MKLVIQNVDSASVKVLNPAGAGRSENESIKKEESIKK